MSIIDNQSGESLPKPFEKVLRAMFSAYARVVVRRKLAGGLSGSLVYLVRPYPPSGPPELPAVVKVDYHDRIAAEWAAYARCIRNRLPQIAAIHQEPTYPPNSLHGGLWYPLVGADTFAIASLRDYYQQHSGEDVQHVLEEQLFPILNQAWQYARLEPELHFGRQYDDFLPPHLRVRLQSPPAGVHVAPLYPDTAHHQPCQTGQWVQLSGFHVIKVYRGDQAGLGLDYPADSPARYRLRVDGLTDVSEYEVGETLQRPLVGQITATRLDVLQQVAQQAVGPAVDLHQESLVIDGMRLPNPLHVLPELLNYSGKGKLAYLHGDLNLENVLVQTASRQANLIDFALAGEYHAIRDLLHLESALVTRLLSSDVAKMGQTAVVIIADFYRRLHCAQDDPGQTPPPGLEKPFNTLLTIRRAARNHALLSGGWPEYYRGLFLYLVGSLRFDDLARLETAPLPRQLALYGAAVIYGLLRHPPDCAKQSRSLGEQLPSLATAVSQPQQTLPPSVLSSQTKMNDQEYRHFRNTLLDQLRQYFNKSDLKDICFRLQLPYEDLEGDTRQDKTRELIEYLERYNRLQELVQICIEQRPQVEWEEIIKQWLNKPRPIEIENGGAPLPQPAITPPSPVVLGVSPTIPEPPAELRENLKNGALVPFFGPGLSALAGLPDMLAIYQEMAQKAGRAMPPAAFVTGEFLLGVVQAYEAQFGLFALNRFLIDRLDRVGISPSRSHQQIAQLPVSTIFTTAYDDLLYRALRAAGRRVNLIVRDTSLAFGGNDRVDLVKLTGDLQQVGSLIVTQADYQTYPQTHPLITGKLQIQLASSAFLFVGYEQFDPLFNLVFNQIGHQLGQNRRAHYAVLLQPDADQAAALRQRGMRVIQLPGGQDREQNDVNLSRWLAALQEA